MIGPDSHLVETITPSPNHGERREGRIPDCIILHYTGMETGAAALAHLCAPQAQVSCHYFVWEDGRIFQLVAENRRAWHAGASCWQGERDINSCSIGIEIVNAGHPGGLPPFPQPQMDAVAALCRDISSRRGIRPERILAHSDIAPGRKVDPGEAFPWAWLASQGVGVWPADVVRAPGDDLSEGVHGPRVRALGEALARMGYDIAPGDRFDARLRLAIEAFQRHFRPSGVDGVADADTLSRLAALAG